MNSTQLSKLLRYSLFLFVIAFTIMCMTTSPAQANQCATFDFLSNTLLVPCFNAGTTSYWIDMGLVNSNPITLEIKNFGDNGSLGNVAECASFDFLTNNLHIPCFVFNDVSYWLDLALVSYDPIQLQLKNFREETVDVSGDWVGTITMYWSDNTYSTDNMALSLIQTGDNVTGTGTTSDGTLTISGIVNDNFFTLSMTLPCSGGDETLTLVHSVSGKTMTAISASGSACPHRVVNITRYSGTLTKRDFLPTQSNFSGTWNGSNTYFSFEPEETGSTTLTLDSALSGTYVINVTSTGKVNTCDNIMGTLENGILYFNLPVSNEDEGHPDCANWDVQCSATLSQNLLTMYLTCSGIFCSSGDILQGILLDTLNKRYTQ